MAEQAAEPQRFRKYDWASWGNGEVWVLKRGKDFTSPIDDMRTMAYAAADRVDKKCRTRRLDQDTLQIQFYAVDGE